jgi:hypothetical protein
MDACAHRTSVALWKPRLTCPLEAVSGCNQYSLYTYSARLLLFACSCASSDSASLLFM